MKNERRHKGYSLEDISLLIKRSPNVVDSRESREDVDYVELIKSLPSKNVLLRSKRIENGNTLEEVAEFCGVDPSKIERWESGEYKRFGERGAKKWMEFFFPKTPPDNTFHHAQSICWTCVHSGKSECSWDLTLTPVEGSFHKIVSGNMKVIVECPLYEKEQRRKYKLVMKELERGEEKC